MLTNATHHWMPEVPPNRPAGRWDGQPSVLIDYKRSLAKRCEARRSVGPYVWIVPALNGAGDTRGFYFASDRHRTGYLAMDRAGASLDLRIMDANDALPTHSRQRNVTGYYVDDHGDTIIRPYVVRLPHGRGFFAAWGEGAGMWGAFSTTIYAGADEAAYAAHSCAEHAADREREFRDEQNAAFDAAEAEGTF
jgi:hypothetical protein